MVSILSCIEVGLSDSSMGQCMHKVSEHRQGVTDLGNREEGIEKAT